MAYATRSELFARFPGLASNDTTETDAELDAMSNWIDGYCSRTFAAEASATDRYYAADDLYVLDLGQWEISTTDGVVIATDDGDNTYGTTLSSSSYILEPRNAPLANPDARPYTSVRLIGTSWPYTVTRNAYQERIKITAKYGWPAVPESVKRATMMLVNNTYENSSGVRSESIDGYSVSYNTASGMSLAVPGPVLSLLGPYRRGWVA